MEHSVSRAETRVKRESATQKVALIGECMIELQRRDGSIKQGYAGDVLNTSTYLARLTKNTPVAVEFVTALGEDLFSNQMVESWACESIGASLVQRLPDRLPGIYFIENDDSGERKFYYWRNDSAAKRMFDNKQLALALEQLSDLQLVYLSGITLAILSASARATLLELLCELKSRGTWIVFDNNYRQILWESAEETCSAYDSLLAIADIALLTWDDEAQLRGYASPDEVVQHCRQFDISELVIKRGSEPCILVTANGREEWAAERVERVVDTTAAGDSFSGAYLAARLRGLSARAAVQWGHRMASLVIQYPGAIIPPSVMPDLDRWQ